MGTGKPPRMPPKRPLLGAVKLLLLSFLSAAPPAPAIPPPAIPLSNLTLAWDPSPSPGISHYKLYIGGVSGNYTNILNAGLSTSVTASNLISGGIYFFAATAVSTNGLESGYSVEISAVPGAASHPPAATLVLAMNNQRQLTLMGSGPPGQSFDILWSSDAASWQPLTRISIGLSGTFSVADPIATGQPMRLFRLNPVAL